MSTSSNIGHGDDRAHNWLLGWQYEKSAFAPANIWPPIVRTPQQNLGLLAQWSRAVHCQLNKLLKTTIRWVPKPELGALGFESEAARWLKWCGNYQYSC